MPPARLHANYRPDIDGLRAVAVLAVLIFHGFPKILPGGFIGVDIFFVISGYLISGIIFSALEKNQFTFRNFYARRVRRIFPALLTVLMACLAFGWWILLPNEFAALGKHILGGTGFSSNFVLWREAGYFDVAAKSKPLLHLWSLGIEEQFYLLWPFLLWAAWRARHRFLWLVVPLFLISFGWNLWTARAGEIGAYYSPLTRFWELWLGALLAWRAQHGKNLSPRADTQSILGAVLIAAGLIVISKDLAFPSFWALLPVCGAALIIAAGPRGVINRALAQPFAVRVGLISYPLYLWHWPLLSFGFILAGKMSDLVRLGLLFASFALAVFTYYFIERPLRFEMKHAVRWLAAGAILAAILGCAAWQNKIPPRHDDARTAQIVTAARDWEYMSDLFETFEIRGQSFYRFGSGEKQILFWGDSHLEQYAPRLQQTLAVHKTAAIFATRGGCSPIRNVFDDQHPECPQNMQSGAELAARADVPRVVIAACWNCFFIDGTRADAKYKFYYDDGSKKIFFTDGGDRLALAQLERQLRDLARQKEVYLVLDNPSGDAFDPVNFFHGSRLVKFEITAAPPPFHLSPDMIALRQKLRAIAQRAGAHVIDPADYLCHNDLCLVADEAGAPIYKDRDHLRASYARKYARFIDKTVMP